MTDHSIPPGPVELVRVLAVMLAVLALSPVVAASAAPAQSPETPKNATIFIVDLSGSMNEPTGSGQTKLDVVKDAFLRALEPIEATSTVGLRVYGDQFAAQSPSARETNCLQDTRLLVPVAEDNLADLETAVNEFVAVGDTPIALALEKVIEDIPEGYLANVVLFSDGRDECYDADLDGDPATGPSYGRQPCEVARELAALGADVRLNKVETVGFGADEAAANELKCIAREGGGGFTNVEDTTDIDQLVDVLVATGTPRVAERLEPSTGIQGGDSMETAPDLDRMGASQARLVYADQISIGEERWYRIADYGPGPGDTSATVFDLPEVSGIELSIRLEPGPDENISGGIGDTRQDVGVPQAPSASVRCGGCSISGGGSHEMFVVVGLSSADEQLSGTFELELLLEGEAWGGTSATCGEGSECWYEARLAEAEERRAEKEDEAALCCDAQDIQPEIDRLQADLDAELALRDSLQAQSASTTNLLPVFLAAALAAAAAGFLVLRRRAVTPSAATAASDDPTVMGKILVPQDEPTTSTEGPTSHDEEEADSTTAAHSAADASIEDPPEAPTVGPVLEEPLEAGAVADRPSISEDEAETDLGDTGPPPVGATKPSGWYPHPSDDTKYRWWDGEAWTDHTHDKDQA